jgi:hypothetical protein
MESVFSALFSLHRGTPHHGEWVVACLQGAWMNLVGERLAAVCQPVSFKDSELTIKVLDKSWEGAILNLKPELLDKLKAVTACDFKNIKMVCG